MSGLTVGYLSIDDLVLELRSTTGTEEEKAYAEKVLPILANRHWLLVTLLLMNAFAMEALPLYLDKVVPEYLAVIISVSLVLLFGEVIPQAICTGPDQVKIASMVAPVTRFLMVASSPISYPIAKALDYLLGEHHKSRFLNNDLKALIELHTFNSLKNMNLLEHHDEHPSTEHSSHKLGLYDEQANLMISALEIREKKVIEMMIPIKSAFMIDYDEVLDKFKLQLMLDKGYSRIPVYSNHNKNDIVGLLRIKNLIGVDVTQNKTLRQLGIELKKPLVISPRLSLIDLLREFRGGRSHMAFVTEQVEELQEKYGLSNTNSITRKDNIGFNKKSSQEIKILGIITLEDVIERMINLDILDEDDYEKISKQKRSQNQSQGYPSSRMSKQILLIKFFLKNI
jgi:metal transporter CNNM